MACKPDLIPFAMFFLLSFFTIATSSAVHENKSIAEAPEASSINAISLLPSLSSFLPKRWRGFHSQRGPLVGGRRAIAELKNTSTSTRGIAPAPAPIASVIEEDDEEKPLSVRWVTGISLGIGTGILTATIASSTYQFFHAYFYRPKPNRPVIFQRKIIDSQSLAFLIKDNSLEALESLGKGGSGEVFKASLENGRIVAIKKTFYSSHEGDAIRDRRPPERKLTFNSAQIHSELNTLGQVRHRNLITLLAYIPKPNYHLLIFDFMENGSLHDVLRKVEEGSYELTWPMRHKIAVDVAKGLKYLHFDCSPKIVHRDLKPSNVLLDNKMEAHIGDFGIARVMPDSMTHLTSNNLTGTVGYIAPEFHQTLRYSTKGDVYAFGILLVVLLTGKEPSHDYFSDLTTYMGMWVNEVVASWEERAMGVVDSQLRGNGLEAEMRLAFKIAAFCLNEAPNERPTSRDILQMLNQIQ